MIGGGRFPTATRDRGAFGTVEHGLPSLDQFPDHDAVLRGFRSAGPLGIGMAPAGPLDVAQMLDALGRHDEARTVLENDVSQPVHQCHTYHLADYLPGIGHADLVSSVQARDRQD